MNCFCDESKIKALNHCIEEINIIIKKDEIDTSTIKEADRKNSLTIVEDSTGNNSSSCNSEQLRLEQNMTLNEEKKDQHNVDYLFQEAGGENYYLHPIDHDILLMEFGSADHFPTEINVRLYMKISINFISNSIINYYILI